MKHRKGNYGYIRSQKKIRLIRTVILFAIAFGIYLIGLQLNHGDKRSIYTIVAIVGMIPVSMGIVSVIMMWMQPPMDAALYDEIRARGEGVTLLYELVLTTREKNLYLDAAAVGADVVAAYTHADVPDSHIHFIEEHITKTLRAAGYKRLVKIFRDKEAFLARLDSLRAHVSEDGGDDHLVAATLCAVAL